MRLVRAPLTLVANAEVRPGAKLLFLCSHNSARSQLAAALWTARTGQPAESAGTHPAARVHRGAVAAARRPALTSATLCRAVLTTLTRTPRW